MLAPRLRVSTRFTVFQFMPMITTMSMAMTTTMTTATSLVTSTAKKKGYFLRQTQKFGPLKGAPI